MRALDLDFRHQTRVSWIGILVLVAGAVSAVVVADQYHRMLAAANEAESGIRAHGVTQRRKPSAPSQPVDVQRVALEVKHARQILLQLSMPWNDLFASVEGVSAPNVALLGIESDVGKQRVKISAEAKNLPAMLDYLHDLEGRAIFADVYLQNHEIQLRDPQRPVRFVVTATWKVRR